MAYQQQQQGPQVYGCTDPAAINYNPNATTDDGSCQLASPTWGCTDPTATNYNSLAAPGNPYANTCTYPISGCTDPCTAINYNSAATVDDGSCTYPPYSSTFDHKVLVFSEKTKGWVSFRSHTDMQNGISMGNDYYTFFTVPISNALKGNLWIHYDENTDRNTFYGDFTESTVSVVLNAEPGSVKVFNTLNYEGSQSKIDQFVSQSVTLPFQNIDSSTFLPNPTTYNDQEIYNLSGKNGWYVNGVFTDMEQGFICEFIGKENKWFNNVSRFINTKLISADTSDFTFQGIGNVTSVINDGTTMAATAVNAEGIVIFDCPIL
jgi:hypothetical protein